jgi:2-polyprenyl-6-methoxyphenol hydroxylase-like FAD-dependent oxidoreductase
MNADWDIVIAGAGLAGLSLAAELSHSDFASLKILLIEPRLSYVRDRTWSFWAAPDALPMRWHALETTRWQEWSVSYLNRSIQASCAYAYTSVRADAFYEHALAAIESASHIQWLKGQAVSQAISHADGVRITTSSGDSMHSAGFLIRGRPCLRLGEAGFSISLAGKWKALMIVSIQIALI